jgi:hypothetical protein
MLSFPNLKTLFATFLGIFGNVDTSLCYQLQAWYMKKNQNTASKRLIISYTTFSFIKTQHPPTQWNLRGGR